MDLSGYFAYFFGGIFLGNAIPHFVNGISGRKFPILFSKLLGKDLSLPIYNVLWGFLNLVVAYFLIFHVWFFNPYNLRDIGMVGMGLLFIGVRLSEVFGRLNQER